MARNRRPKPSISLTFQLWCIAAGMSAVLIAGLVLRA
jgi:hypothetical protein